MTVSNACTLFVAPVNNSFPEVGELKKSLENGSEEVKIDAMKGVLALLSSGNHAGASSLLMTIIRFVMPNQKNKLLKKLVLLYFEMIPKVDGDGKLLSEMILVCNALRSELEHPNEYVRGVTLRFLTRIYEPEIIEPLDRSIRLCLEHRHPYVRRNAIMAVYSIYCLGCETLFTDAPELIQQVLAAETDAGCTRNALMALSKIAPDMASDFIFGKTNEQILRLDPLIHLTIIEFLVEDSAVHRDNVQRNVRLVAALLQGSPAPEVKFEAASALMLLSSSPNAIRAVVSCYVELAVKEADNNAKLMVLDKLAQLQAKHAVIVNENILEVLRVLLASDLSVRIRALEIILTGINGRLAPELIGFLVKEVSKVDESFDGAKEYRPKILATISACAVRFPPVSPLALNCFLDLVQNGSDPVLIRDALNLSKGILARNTALRKEALGRLISCINYVTDPESLEGLFWILGEFVRDADIVQRLLDDIKSSLGALPIVESEVKARERAENDGDELVARSPALKTRLNADGTYATESVMTTDVVGASQFDAENIRHLLLKGQYDVYVAMAVAITKIALSCSLNEAAGQVARDSPRGFAMLIISSSLRVGMSTLVTNKIEKDSFDRMMLCLNLLANNEPAMEEAFVKDSHAAFEQYLKRMDKARKRETFGGDHGPVEEAISFRLAKAAIGDSLTKVSVAPGEMERDVQKALLGEGAVKNSESASLLSKVTQLTGFSDVIYAETYVTISHNDILLDILLVNQLEETLQNVNIELSCSGDLKVGDKPPSLTLPPLGFAVTKASVKIRSTDNGVIFGCITYGVTDIQTIMLSTIPIDILEYIKATSISDADFRRIWILLEWENKILIPSIPGLTLQQVIEALLAEIHLCCITPSLGISENGDYLAANLYAQSLFGEEVLANVCLERTENVESLSPAAKHKGPIVTGHLRLRSKTQGIAVAIGERITRLVQKLSKS